MARKPPRQFRSAARNATGVRTVLVLLGRRVREGRKNLALTQEQAAEKMGLDEKHLQLIETGQTNPTVATLVAVARGLGVEVSSLLRQRR
jgi:transcriptional regulator with XRE-family HTH domain